MFFNTKNSENDINQKIAEYRNQNSDQIKKDSQQLVLELFHQAAKRVPAYRDFLSLNKIDPHKIKTIEDFEQVPIINKKNYLTQYEMKDLSWDGQLNGLSIISSSSGSTGKPYYWPRGIEQEREGALMHELMFKEFYGIDDQSTLYINCFAMGTWVAGTYVLSSIERLSWKGYRIITISPGIEANLILQQFSDLAPRFDQIIIGGYPPFIKDVLDEGEQRGINWKEFKIKFLFAAEGYSEQWRDYVHQKVGTKNSYSSSLNCYGSADAGLLAHETPLANGIRQQLATDYGKMENFFGDNRLPTFAQYDPRIKYFESIEGKLIFSARSGIPLIRYDIGDNGSVEEFESVKTRAIQSGVNWTVLENAGIPMWHLPFVSVFGRQDLTVSLYGVLIFPEYIKYALEKMLVDGKITGKFKMSTELNEYKDQYLLVKIELAKGASGNRSYADRITKNIFNWLINNSSEMEKLHQSIGVRAMPVIELIENGGVDFKIGAKQKWVKN